MLDITAGDPQFSEAEICHSLPLFSIKVSLIENENSPVYTFKTNIS